MCKPVKGIIDGREIVDDRGYDCPTQLEDGTAVYIIPTADLEALVELLKRDLQDFAATAGRSLELLGHAGMQDAFRAFLAERNLEVGE